MIPIPNLNTDNFYRFLTVLGIVIIWFSNSELNAYRAEVNNEMEEYKKVGVYDKTNDYYIGTSEELIFLSKISEEKNYAKRVEISKNIIANNSDSINISHLNYLVARIQAVDTTTAQVKARFRKTIMKIDSLYYEIQNYNRGIALINDTDVPSILNKIKMYKFFMAVGLLILIFGAFKWYTQDKFAKRIINKPLIRPFKSLRNLEFVSKYNKRI